MFKSKVGNCLLSRSILLAMLVVALGGAYAIEQPGSSRLPLYPRWEQWIYTKGVTTWMAAWWARLYGALTPYLGHYYLWIAFVLKKHHFGLATTVFNFFVGSATVLGALHHGLVLWIEAA